MNMFVDVVGNENDNDFFEKNSGPDKLHPGGSTYLFKDKEVMCLERWKTKGSSNDTPLYDLDVYRGERVTGVIFFKIDGHWSRLEYAFL